MSIDVIKIFDVIVLCLGIFLFFGAFQIKKGIIPTTFVPADALLKCHDLDGMKKRLFPATILFAAVSLVYGIYSILFDFHILNYSNSLTSFFNVFLIIAFIVTWVFFSRVLKKAVEEYC